MKKILLMAIAIMMIPMITFAENFVVDLAASSKTIESNLAVMMEVTNGQILSAGGGITVIDHDEKIINGKILMKGKEAAPGFQYGVGLKWLGSDKIGYDEGKDYELNALGLLFAIEYDMLALPGSSKAPVVITAEVSGAPSSLCFEDAKSYIDAKVRASVYVLPNALIFVQVSYYKIKFEDNPEFKFRDSDMFLGVSFQF
ncbi:MAG: hypothetical protein GY760_16925 [Deltaproteobacteria bacterium]|nr:hypothetical protein [Deltaproteobacteria bacterium]